MVKKFHPADFWKQGYFFWPNHTRIKQHSKVTFLGCMLEETMSGESMVHKVISKVDVRLKFLHWKNKCLTPNLCRFNTASF